MSGADGHRPLSLSLSMNLPVPGLNINDLLKIRFRGSKREIPFGRNLSPLVPRGGRGAVGSASLRKGRDASACRPSLASP